MGKRSRKRTAPGGGSWAATAPAAPAPERGPRAAIKRAWEASAEPSAKPAAPASSAAAARSVHARRPDRRARLHELPKAPWSPFPLVELVILAGLVLIGVAFATGGGSHGGLLILGFGCVSAGGIELAVREHLHGFRSHSALIAGFVAVAFAIPMFLLTPIPQAVLLVLAVVVFGVSFQTLRAVFSRRSGGLSFRA